MKIPNANCLLMVIDIQQKLMPVIKNGAEVIGNVSRLLAGAEILQIPVIVTEQNPNGLGKSVPELPLNRATLFEKFTFDAMENPELENALQSGASVVVVGCESHVCVLQTVLGLLKRNIVVFVVEDAIGSRSGASKAAAIRRMATNGAEIVTTEMVLFEWLGSSQHPSFRKVLELVR